MSLKSIKEKYEKDLLAKKNVTGVGIGLKNGKGEPCILVAVTEKVDISKLNENDIIPKELEKHFKTDVIAVGELTQLNEWKKEHRPVRLGASCCWEGLTACSSGLPIYDESGEQYVLMNQHCISADGKAKVGDKVLQPSPSDGGGNPVGEVTEMNFPVSSENEDNIDMSIFKATEEFIHEDVAGNAYIPETGFLDETYLLKNIIGGGRTVGQVSRCISIAVDFTAGVWGTENGKKVVRYFKDCVMALNVDADDTDRAVVYGGDSSSIRFIDNRPMVQTFAGSEMAAIFNQTAKSLDYAKKVWGKEFVLEKETVPVIGYIAMNEEFANDTETLVNLRFRSEPRLGNNIIKVLKKGTKIVILDYAGYSSGYFWLKVQV
jgi:hypothetical protein